jgi:nucleoside-diphosphate-sugar epimerase
MGSGAPSTRRAVLVLGGTGFIGSHLVDRLGLRGLPVRVASISGRWRWGAAPAGTEWATLDLRDLAQTGRLEEVTRGASTIVNLVGALYRPGLSPKLLREVHVGAVRRVLSAARASVGEGAVRVVHVSTTGVLGPTGPEPLDESAEPSPMTPYEATKLEGERAALAGRGDGVEVVVVRPGLVYGPRDLHLLALYHSIDRGLFRPIAGGRARWQPIHVRDLCRGIAAAIDRKGIDGQVFHLAGAEVVELGDLARRIASLLGTRLRGPGLPYGAAMAVGAVLELGLRPLGIEPPLSRSRVRTLTEDRVYRIDRARRMLEFEPEIPLDDGLAETVGWYREHGYI